MRRCSLILGIIWIVLTACGETISPCQEPVETLNKMAWVLPQERVSESDYKENGLHSIQITTVLTPLSLSMEAYGVHYRDQIVRNPAWTLVRETGTADRYDSDWMIHGVCGDMTAHFALAQEHEGSYTMETTITARQP